MVLEARVASRQESFIWFLNSSNIMSYPAVQTSPFREDLQVLLDGTPVKLPPGGRSLRGVRCYLESLALEQQRILYAFKVDGAHADSMPLYNADSDFSRVEGVTIKLDELHVYLIRLAKEQAERARAATLTAAELVVVTDCSVAREFWWDLAVQLRKPLLTLSLLPEGVCGGAFYGTPVSQLRKWQLQQLGMIIRKVDEACWTEDVRVLLGAIEGRVLTWLTNLESSLDLLLETVLCAVNPRTG